MIGGYEQTDGTELWFWAMLIIGAVGLAEYMTWKFSERGELRRRIRQALRKAGKL